MPLAAVLTSASLHDSQVAIPLMQKVSDLKDNYGAYHIRVKGHWKVLCHLIFSIIALTVKQLFNMLN